MAVVDQRATHNIIDKFQIYKVNRTKTVTNYTQHYITSELIMIHFQLDRKRVQWNIKKYESIQYSKRKKFNSKGNRNVLNSFIRTYML